MDFVLSNTSPETKNESISDIRQILLKAYCLIPQGVYVLHQWYDQAKNGQMSARQLLNAPYSERSLFLKMSRDVTEKCKMIMSIRGRNDRKYNDYANNTADDLLSIVFKTTIANQVIAPSDRRLLILGEYLQQQKDAVSEKERDAILQMAPALETLKETESKPVHRLELAYVTAIITKHVKLGQDLALRMSSERKKATGLRPAARFKNVAALSKQNNRRVFNEELRTLFKVDWSNVSTPPPPVVPAVKAENARPHRTVAKPRAGAVFDPDKKFAYGKLIHLCDYDGIKKLPSVEEALRNHNPPILSRSQFLDFGKKVAGSKCSNLSKIVDAFLEGNILKARVSQPTPTLFATQIANGLGLTLSQAYGHLGITERQGLKALPPSSVLDGFVMRPAERKPQQLEN